MGLNDKIQWYLKAQELSVILWLEDAITGALKPGVTIADLDYRYIRVATDNDVTYTSSDQSITALSGLTDSHDSETEGQAKMYEIGLGAYRLDIPDVMCADGADFAEITIWDAANNTILPAVLRIELLSAAPTLAMTIIGTPEAEEEITADSITNQAELVSSASIQGEYTCASVTRI